MTGKFWILKTLFDFWRANPDFFSGKLNVQCVKINGWLQTLINTHLFEAAIWKTLKLLKLEYGKSPAKFLDEKEANITQPHSK